MGHNVGVGPGEFVAPLAVKNLWGPRRPRENGTQGRVDTLQKLRSYVVIIATFLGFNYAVSDMGALGFTLVDMHGLVNCLNALGRIRMLRLDEDHTQRRNISREHRCRERQKFAQAFQARYQREFH